MPCGFESTEGYRPDWHRSQMHTAQTQGETRKLGNGLLGHASSCDMIPLLSRLIHIQIHTTGMNLRETESTIVSHHA